MTIIRRMLCSATILLALLWPQGGFAADIFMLADGGVIPSSAKVIEDYAFYGCAALEGELNLPSGVTEIGDYAFYDCGSLTGELTLPPDIERIGDYAFYGCTGLTGDICIPADVAVGEGAFDNTNLRISYEGVPQLSIEAPGNRLAAGYQMQLGASISPESIDGSVLWTSSDDAIAVVSETGLVTGVEEGTVTITATSVAKPELSAAVVITVSRDPLYRALLIGNTYPGTSSALPGCETDVRAMAAMLGTMDATAYDVTIARNLSANGMIEAILDTFSDATEYDVSLLYYTGHGYATSGQLVGADRSVLNFARLRAALDMIPGKKVVILDSCYSGNAIGKSLLPAAEEESGGVLEYVNNEIISAFSAVSSSPMMRSGELASSDYYVLTAARGSQQSAATTESGVAYSLFTRCLLRGSGYDQITSQPHALRADTDSNGGVTLEEGYCYVRDHIDEIRYFDQDVQVYPENCNLLLWGRELN